MTTRDLTDSKVSLTIMVVCLLFTASSAWAVAWAWYENKAATERLVERIVVLDAKMDRALQSSWTYREEKSAWDQVWYKNPGFKIPDLKDIREEYKNN